LFSVSDAVLVSTPVGPNAYDVPTSMFVLSVKS
jgi:hypothetical protein